MTKALHIAPGVDLPLDAVTQTFGVLAKRGSGKTYLGMVMAEEMIKAGAHVVAIDPIGVWWGLRSSSDGTKPGLPVLILGGEHADVPIEPTSGVVVAEFVIENHVPAVIDLALFRKKEAKQFMLAFAETLYHRNRDPLHLMLDEADEWAPQKPFKGDERLLGAIEDLVRRGRARGIGATLITQRSAVLNKDVLTQIEVLITLRIVSPQDRAAIEEWVKVHGDRELWQRMVLSLASLPIGTAWLWSPGWLEIFEKINVRKRETFDSSATPKAGAKVTQSKALAEVDTEALRSRLADVIERHDAEDPKKLQARIRELEVQLSKAPAIDVQTQIVEVPLFSDTDRALLHNDVMEISGLWKKIHEETTTVREHIYDLVRRIDAFDEFGIPKPHVPERSRMAERPVAEMRKSATPRSAAPASSSLTKAERLILTVLAQYPAGRTTVQIAILTGYAVNGGGFRNALGSLNSKGYLSRASLITITDAGLDALGPFDPLPTGRALLSYWLEQLSKAEALSLRAIAEAYPKRIAVEDVAASAGYESKGGGFRNALGKLRTLQLIEGRGELRASDALFERSRA